jgi:hypothetical protein
MPAQVHVLLCALADCARREASATFSDVGAVASQFCFAACIQYVDKAC